MSFGSLTSLENWEGVQKANLSSFSDLIFSRALSRSDLTNIFLRLFDKTSCLGLLELGCGGGGFIGTLLHLLKNHGVVSITGVDWSRDLGKQFKAVVDLRGINSSFVESDLFAPDLCSRLQQYDVVASGGLIEHFLGAKFNYICDLHDQLCRPGGKVLISVPNLLGVRYYWHSTFDRENFMQHSLDVMRPEVLIAYYKQKGYVVDFCGYYGDLPLWWSSDHLAWRDMGLRPKVGSLVLRFYNRLVVPLMSVLPTSISPSFFCPYLMLVATKPLSQGS
jgi:2-polyprenyl-3-methyl-5-hydroxy-6-metoxy-1,4-benzoquinol methylase